VAFTAAEKFQIARALVDAGVDEIEAGTPAMGGEDIEAIAEIRHIAGRARTIAWGRMTEQDVAAACRTGVACVNLSVPVSDRQIRAKYRGGPDEVLARIAHVVPHARGKGLRVFVGGRRRRKVSFRRHAWGDGPFCGRWHVPAAARRHVHAAGISWT
jgi:homocitrate synthase NifV